ncbi:putative glucitol transport protein GutA [Diplonema papillatum]|nr:putative glucitol transport protein GutA [Diplonema papillatum]
MGKFSSHTYGTDETAKSVYTDDEPSLEVVEPMSSLEKLSFAMGALVNAISVACTGFFLNPFLLEIASLRPSIVSAMMLVGRVFDAITTAIVGALVSKYPNLRLWLKVVTVPTCAAYFFLWMVWNNWSETYRAVWAFGMYMLFQLGTSGYHVPYTALTVRMHWDPKQRDLATTWRMLAEILSVLFGAGVQGFILAQYGGGDDCRACEGNDDGSTDEQTGYLIAAFVMTVVMLVGGLICPFGVIERVEAKVEAEEDKVSTSQALKFAFKSRSFVMLTTAFFFVWLTVQGVQGNILLYCKYAVKSWKDDFQYLLGALVLCATIGMPLWMMVMKRIGKRLTYLIGACGLAPMLHVLYWLPDDTPVGYGIALCVAAGFALAAAYLLPWAMLPSVVDEAELMTGRRDEAVFYAFFVFFMKMGAGVALAGSALAIDIAGWVDPCCLPADGQDVCDCDIPASCNCDVQPESVGNALRLIVGVIGPGLIVVGVVFILMFPITPERESEIEEGMKQLRDADNAALIPGRNSKRMSTQNAVALTQGFPISGALRNSENLTDRRADGNPLAVIAERE